MAENRMVTGFIPFQQFPFQRIGEESDMFTIFISKATRFPSLQKKLH